MYNERISHLPGLVLAIATLAILAAFYNSGLHSRDRLSPQGCRMSWMSPSYVLQSDFNATWTRLSRRYSLWLYREVGWESHEQLTGVPVLFIPGNAGSSHQVRSIASSATRQYYVDPHIPRQEFVSRGIKQLDFFAVEFNEDFSALHGPTLLSERSYTSSAIRYILSLYPPRTQIIIVAHSMGGIVALSLLPSVDISAIITMSTPHLLPPARLDKRIEDIYSDSWHALRNDSMPVLSICGGATDLTVPSETCPMEHFASTAGWRKTIFTTCLEGAWTGVGHREMVWCHQVRWRVARAALELGVATNNAERATTLQRWFRDRVDPLSVSSSSSSNAPPPLQEGIAINYIPPDQRLVLRSPPRESNLYLLPVPPAVDRVRFTLFVSHGTVLSLSPFHGSDLSVAVYSCRFSALNCRPLQPQNLRLIPSPSWEARFPAPGEGVDESDGVVLFEAGIDPDDGTAHWIGVAVQGGGGQGGWVIGGFNTGQVARFDGSVYAPLWKEVEIAVSPISLVTEVQMQNVLLDALLVYRVEPSMIIGSCKDVLLPPLLLHSSSPSESHFYPMDGQRPLLLHTHAFGPFIPRSSGSRHNLNISIYSSGECGVSRLTLTVDWWSTLGRWALRYWTTVCAWSVGVVGVILVRAWDKWEKGAVFLTVPESLAWYTSKTLLPLSGLLFLASLLPLDSSLLLGNAGEFILAPLAPVVLFVASGCVAISWFFLQALMWIVLRVASLFGRVNDETRVWKRNIWSLGIILLLVATVIPSQVAFLVCFLMHLYTSAVQSPTTGTSATQEEAHAQKAHLLLLLFWLLPLVAPVLAVWVRTLATAGLTTPFDGDHDVLAVASFLFLVDFASSSTTPFLEKASSTSHRYVGKAIFYALAVVPFAFGGRYTYRVYSMSNVTVSYLIASRLKSLWTSSAVK